MEFLREDAGGVCAGDDDDPSGGARNEFPGEIGGILPDEDGGARNEFPGELGMILTELSFLAEFIGERSSPLPCMLEQSRLEAGMVIILVLISIRAEFIGDDGIFNVRSNSLEALFPTETFFELLSLSSSFDSTYSIPRLF